MGYKTKVQQIRRKSSRQWYVTLPSALAQALEFKKGETVEWQIDKQGGLRLHRKTGRK